MLRPVRELLTLGVFDGLVELSASLGDLTLQSRFLFFQVLIAFFLTQFFTGLALRVKFEFVSFFFELMHLLLRSLNLFALLFDLGDVNLVQLVHELRERLRQIIRLELIQHRQFVSALAALSELRGNGLPRGNQVVRGVELFRFELDVHVLVVQGLQQLHVEFFRLFVVSFTEQFEHIIEGLLNMG